jgi:hypothetical protein
MDELGFELAQLVLRAEGAGEAAVLAAMKYLRRWRLGRKAAHPDCPTCGYPVNASPRASDGCRIWICGREYCSIDCCVSRTR